MTLPTNVSTILSARQLLNVMVRELHRAIMTPLSSNVFVEMYLLPQSTLVTQLAKRKY